MERRSDIWITIGIAAALITALSFILPKNSEKYLSELFWTRKTFAPAKYNVLILGDSRLYRGLSPEIMESKLPGLKVLNFAYSNGGLNKTMFEAAEKKLAKNKKPKVIVLGITANTVTGYTAGNKQYLQELNRSREEIWERLYFNPMRYWFSATSPEELKTYFLKKEEKSYYRNKYFMNGYVQSEKFPVDTTEAIPSYTKDFNKFKVEDKYLSQLFNQVENWSSRGIKVVAFYPPVSQPMQMLEDTLGLYNIEIVKNGIEKASGHWINLNSGDFKTYDGSHLTIESADKLSIEVADNIKQLLSETK